MCWSHLNPVTHVAVVGLQLVWLNVTVNSVTYVGDDDCDTGCCSVEYWGVTVSGCARALSVVLSCVCVCMRMCACVRGVSSLYVFVLLYSHRLQYATVFWQIITIVHTLHFLIIVEWKVYHFRGVSRICVKIEAAQLNNLTDHIRLTD